MMKEHVHLPLLTVYLVKMDFPIIIMFDKLFPQRALLTRSSVTMSFL